MSKQPPPAPTASAVGPCPTLIWISRTHQHWKFTQHHRTTPVKGPRMILTYTAKNVYWLIYLTTLINFCTQIFNKFHKLFPRESQETNLILPWKCQSQSIASLEHFWAKIFKTFHEIYVLEFSHVWSCHKIGQGQPKVIIWTILVVLQYPMLQINQDNRFTGSRRKFCKAFHNE